MREWTDVNEVLSLAKTNGQLSLQFLDDRLEERIWELILTQKRSEKRREF